MRERRTKNVLFINGVRFAIGDEIVSPKGTIGVITGYSVDRVDDDRPLKADFIDESPCTYWGPNASDPMRRITKVGDGGKD